MKKILIIAPHFPPSNLAGVHRSRLFAQHLPSFGWSPIILTVHEDFYEETLDRNLEKMLPKNLRIEKTNAFGVTRRRLIGDIGLRSFFQLYRKARSIIKNETINFLYIPIPSFYVALLGRWLHARTGVQYGIDYIDPWVHEFAGSEKLFSRHWLSTKLSSLLEPIAVKKASLITGVAEGYYKGVRERNPHLRSQAVFAAMPYGGEKMDHEQIKNLTVRPYLFEKKDNKIQFVYAGAMLPKAYALLEAMLASIVENIEQFKSIEFHFIGSGKLPNDPDGYNIKPLAEKYGLWQAIIFEYPKRIPYLDVLVHLDAAEAIFVLGSTERHYTPSKIYQGVLSGKPVFAILHKESTAAQVLDVSGAGMVLSFDGDTEVGIVRQNFSDKMQQFLTFCKTYNPAEIKMEEFDRYSAYNVTKLLAEEIEKALEKNNGKDKDFR